MHVSDANDMVDEDQIKATFSVGPAEVKENGVSHEDIEKDANKHHLKVCGSIGF